MNKVSMYILIFFCLSCLDNNLNRTILITGNLRNLPDGTLNMIVNNKDIISSTRSKNGHFQFLVNMKDYNEPILVELQHIDSKNCTRFFHYKTMKKYKNGSLSIQYFFLEDGIELKGDLDEINSMNIKLMNDIKLVISPIKPGVQTKVMFEDSLDFESLKKMNDFKLCIEKNPHSYYYLYGLKRRISDFNNTQFLTLLECFNKDLQESKTGKMLRNYIINRNNKKLDFTTFLIDRNDKKQAVLQKNAKINMVVLWASWCGPCRKEIPQLKKIHSQFANNPLFNMVSVSLDDNKENWYKALDKEQMPWKQLLITPEATTYSKELFSFNGSIPTTLFVDNEGQIIKKFVGYDEKSLEEFMALIEQYTVSNRKNDL